MNKLKGHMDEIAGMVVLWLSVWTRDTKVVRSNPACATIIGEEGNGKPPYKVQFSRRNSERCLWFLLHSNSSMRRSFVNFTALICRG